MVEKKTKFPLGQLLVEKEVITPEQLEIALKKQKETGELLGITLLELGFVDEETVFLPVVAGQHGVDYISLKNINISKEAIDQIPAKFVSHYKIIPVDFKSGVLTIATTKPDDVHLVDELGLVVSARIKSVLASEKEILETIRKFYGVGAETIEQMMGTVDTTEDLIETIDHIDENDSEASISKFLNQILLEAYNDRATDIHIEPYENELAIRYRTDGILHDAKVPINIRHFKDSLVSRIKILCNLNIAEKRSPQDGRFKVKVAGIDIDLRVSTLPTPFGESVVMRLLNSTQLFSFEDLGLEEFERKILNDLIVKSHGIIFLTGPTGSGKTTTLYSALSKINTEEKKIITIEDPIEYQLKGITQIQINPGVGLTFAQGLRSMLRHDPDVMMVGEVRDVETADISIQVALTGHLVFSTLHTNDAAGGVARLLDMGVEPYLITSTIECFIAQRLARLVCQKCRKAVVVTEDMALEFEGQIKVGETIYEAQGCEACNSSGYVGREALYEFLVMTEEVRNLIMERATASQIKEKAVVNGMRTLSQSGWSKVQLGITTPQEVIRVTQEEE